MASAGQSDSADAAAQRRRGRQRRPARPATTGRLAFDRLDSELANAEQRAGRRQGAPEFSRDGKARCRLRLALIVEPNRAALPLGSAAFSDAPLTASGNGRRAGRARGPAPACPRAPASRARFRPRASPRPRRRSATRCRPGPARRCRPPRRSGAWRRSALPLGSRAGAAPAAAARDRRRIPAHRHPRRELGPLPIAPQPLARRRTGGG